MSTIKQEIAAIERQTEQIASVRASLGDTLDAQTVVPRWTFEPGQQVLVRFYNSVHTATISRTSDMMADWNNEIGSRTRCDSGRVVPRTTDGIHELKRQLATLEGEIAATRNELDRIYVECADAEGL